MRGRATDKYIKILGMETVSDVDKVSFMRLMMKEERDQCLRAFLQEWLSDGNCNLPGLLNVLHLHTATFIHNCYIIFWARQTLNVADGVFRLTAAQLNLSLWGECL